ncbi:hypothetical protein F1Z29_07160 [Clostridium perfringens]|nr:hypothetical protein [Clostridium perfringens]
MGSFKKIRKKNIEQGDIVLAECKNTKAPVIVLNVLEISQKKRNIKNYKILEKNKNNIFI